MPLFAACPVDGAPAARLSLFKKFVGWSFSSRAYALAREEYKLSASQPKNGRAGFQV
jgi:hypothetical protein